MKLPVISLAILGGQAYLANAQGGDIGQKLGKFAGFYTGLDLSSGSPQFDASQLLIGYGPWVVKRFVGAVARPRVNMKGLPISLS